MFDGGISGGTMGVIPPTSAAQPDARILVVLSEILGDSIAAIAVGMLVAPESGSGTLLKRADPSAAAWETAPL